jgi:hypothetical protein
MISTKEDHMSLTRKHFLQLAEIAKKQNKRYDSRRKCELIDSLAQFCANNSQNFNRERFIAACGDEK